MKPGMLKTFTAALIAMAFLGSGLALAQDRDRLQDREQDRLADRDRDQDRDRDIYGSELMTRQGRREYRNRMGEMATVQAYLVRGLSDTSLDRGAGLSVRLDL